MAEIETNKLVIIKGKFFPKIFPKKPDIIDPTRGKKTIAYSIYPFIELIFSTCMFPEFLK